MENRSFAIRSWALDENAAKTKKEIIHHTFKEECPLAQELM